MASQPGGKNQGSPLSKNFKDSPWFQEFIAGIRRIAPALSLPDESPLREEILTSTKTEFSDGEVVNVTIQIEIFSVMMGIRQQIHELTNRVTELARTIRSLSNNARDHSTNVAASTAKITPHISRVQKQSRTYAEAAATLKETPAPKTPPKGKKRSATVGPTSLKNPKQKQKKKVKVREDVAEPVNDTPLPPQHPAVHLKTITIARRRIYATRATPRPLPSSAKLEPKISIAMAKELQKCGCSAPTNLQIHINATTSTISLTAPPGSEPIKYTGYLAPRTTTLNAILPEGSQNYMEFRRASADSQVVIYGLSLEALLNEEETLLSLMQESLFVGQQVNITTARFLQKCYLYGHPEEGCKATHHTCPICAGERRLKEHKWPSPTCPKKGDRKIIADCCPDTLSKCAAPCGRNHHTAYFVECPVKTKAKQDAKEDYDQRRASQSSEGMDTTKYHN